MTTLHHRRLTPAALRRLIAEAPSTSAELTDDHRLSLTARFRAVPSQSHRRLDAWSVETAGRPSGPFQWTPQTARRVIGNASLSRVMNNPSMPLLDAVNDEVADLFYRAAAGYARPGSLAYWLAGVAPAVVSLVTAEALNWATQLGEIAHGLEGKWSLYPTDAYYDVASARTTLRARRDIGVNKESGRVLLRVRAGLPGKSAGPGLRADLTIDTLANENGQSPQRIIGIWPDAGVLLSVDGTMADLRAGARDLVRTAVAQQRQNTRTAA
jgi:hypothetical protein